MKPITCIDQGTDSGTLALSKKNAVQLAGLHICTKP